MPQPGNVGEAQIEDFRIVVPGELENFLGVSHQKTPYQGKIPAEIGRTVAGSPAISHACHKSVASMGHPAGCYNRSRCAGPRESKGSRGLWQFDCFYGGDNATLYWRYRSFKHRGHGGRGGKSSGNWVLTVGNCSYGL